ncbi:hypothetical protein CIPAW_16G063400 [Carya illinoinensis]|uniref:Uncharacterized protein n=1 Tax=Carya illinoinensis TaxID=32201 RepID=A0A8T1N507_CARIL|nr:hypothetical protein CIPAW_16G063400 [Carya illinoinensis]
MAREHIEEIRRKKFSIGGELNPLTEDLHQAVKNLYVELYAKDNVEDNEYVEGVDPSLEFLITSEDIAGRGALATFLIFNNEKGFSSKNIDSICRSVHQERQKKRGYIGENGIGFKSVFLITAQPYIFSSGYQIRFNEEPCPHCNLGYIVLEWVEENPRLSDIQQIYGSQKYPPTTTIVLPLKPDQRLLEVLLFLTKLKRLSVREHNKNPKLNTVSAIAITSETNFVMRKNIDAESSTFHLSAERKNNGIDEECSYYMWKQKFPVRHENKVESADFLLASSRETILLDSKWNQGILDCVSSAFIDAFVSLVRTSDHNIPPLYLAPMFRFIPINCSSYQDESYTPQKFFHKPCKVGRLMPDFWNILEQAEKQGVSLLNLSSHGKYILSSSFDKGEYDHILSFLGVELVNNEWYAKCIKSFNLVVGVTEDVYLEILLLVATNWKSKFDSTEMKNIPLIKYLGVYGDVSLCIIIQLFHKMTLQQWLQENVKVGALDVHDYAVHLNGYINNDRKLANTFVHFLYHSFSKSYLSKAEVDYLCGIMPLINNYGNLTRQTKGVLVPANWSKLAGLIGSNPWRGESYVELGEAYLCPGPFAGESCSEEQLLEFLKTHVVASDIPYISPPIVKILAITTNGCSGYRPPSWSCMLTSSLGNILQSGSLLVDIPLIDQSFYGVQINKYKEELKTIGVMFKYGEAYEFIGKHLMSLADSSTLTRGQVLSIFNFIRFLRANYLALEKFISIVKERRWLMTSRGDMSLVGSILFDHKWKVASQISNLPFIDTGYFGDEILSFKEELRSLGVLIGFSGNYKLVVENLKSPSSLSSLTAEAIIFILKCMNHSGQSNKLIGTLSGVKCFKTNIGYKSPGECFINELQQLGIMVDVEEVAQVFGQSFKQRAASMMKENVLFFLSCYRLLKDTPHKFPSDLMKCIYEVKWLQTRLGDLRSPSNCILYGPNWQSIAPITLLSFIDDSDNYYGKDIHEYKKELKSIGVVTKFKDGVKFIADGVFSPQDPFIITPANVVALLEFILILLHDHAGSHKFPDSFYRRISQKWLKKNDGYRPPDQCYLFDSTWGSHLKHTDGPFLDEGFYGSNIRSYKKELNAIHVTVNVKKGCLFIASHLNFHHEFSTTKRIWIPYGTENGKWASPEECVLHDKDDLFSFRVQVLEKYPDQKLLSFFSKAFNVKSNPSIDDYCQLWKIWKTLRPQLPHEDCFKFWVYVSKHWSGKTERTLIDRLEKLPVASDSDVIFLSNKHDAFIANDLQLKDLFEQVFPRPIFVWYPERSSPSLPRTKLLEIYKKIGVQTTFARLNAVKGLLNITFLEKIELIIVNYTLSLSSGENVELKVSRMIHWDREASKLFAQKLDKSSGYMNMIENATYFFEAISESLLWENSDHIGALVELIKLFFILEYNEEVVGFMEDEEFLASIFP